MRRHCDSVDGPVVAAARRALATHDANIAPAFIPKDGEGEVGRAFEQAPSIRDQGPAVREIADLHFFETVVSVHRAGGGAPFTGLRPAGLDHGPAIPITERARQRIAHTIPGVDRGLRDPQPGPRAACKGNVGTTSATSDASSHCGRAGTRRRR